MTIRVVIADDQQLVRAGFRKILEAEDDITVLAEASDGLEAIAAARLHQPDVVLMDIRMPDMDGLEATRQLLRGDPALTRVLILTTFDLDEYVYQALHAGASGFLVKTHVARVLMKLNLADRVHAVIFAYETGLVQPGEA
jgi:DNA-binding NarL/FixJ family response regulator